MLPSSVTMDGVARGASSDGGMPDGFAAATYGDAMADIYDVWYDATLNGTSDVATAVAALSAWADGGSALELGIGTGRLAIPLAAAGVRVFGIDASAAMVARLGERSPEIAARTTVGDMVGRLPGGPHHLVFVAYNTFFGAPTVAAQAQVMREAAAVLAPGGRFVVEAFVPDTPEAVRSGVDVREVGVDKVVLHAHRTDPAAQTVTGSYVEITEAGGVRLRPYHLRWSTPDELDAMAAAAGFALEHRWSSWAGEPFGVESTGHVSVWRRPA
jgi:SAM-dependent methyltransferase